MQVYSYLIKSKYITRQYTGQQTPWRKLQLASPILSQFTPLRSLPVIAALYATNMKLSTDDYNVLSYVLKKNIMSYDQAVSWSYAQYTDQGIDPFIENVSLASDVSEIIELISNAYQVYGKPSKEFLAGEVAKAYSEGRLSLEAAISHILFGLDLELPDDERKELYIAEDYFGWHEAAESRAILHAKPLFDKYRPIYESAVAKFGV